MDTLLPHFHYSQTDHARVATLELLLPQFHTAIANAENELNLNFEKVVDTDKAAKLYYTLAVYHLRHKGEYKEAFSFLTKANNLCKNAHDRLKISRQLAKVNRRLKNHDEAKRIYNTMFEQLASKKELNLDDIDALCDIGNFYTKTNPKYSYPCRDLFGNITIQQLHSKNAKFNDELTAARCFDLALHKIADRRETNFLKKKAAIFYYKGEHYWQQSNMRLTKYRLKYKVDYLQKALADLKESLKLNEEYDPDNHEILAHTKYKIASVHYELKSIVDQFDLKNLASEPDLFEAEKLLQAAIIHYDTFFKQAVSNGVLGDYLVKTYGLLKKIYKMKCDQDKEQACDKDIEEIKSYKEETDDQGKKRKTQGNPLIDNRSSKRRRVQSPASPEQVGSSDNHEEGNSRASFYSNILSDLNENVAQNTTEESPELNEAIRTSLQSHEIQIQKEQEQIQRNYAHFEQEKQNSKFLNQPILVDEEERYSDVEVLSEYSDDEVLNNDEYKTLSYTP